MSKQAELSAAVRTDLGKGPTGRLRKTGRVPGVMYGHEVEPTAVDVDALELYHVLHTEAGRNVMIRLEVAGKTHLTIARELQRHPVMSQITHLDFLAVSKDVPIVVEVRVSIEGEPSDAEGVVQQVLNTVPILVKPLEVPNELTLSVEGLSIGNVLRVSDLTLPAGATADIDANRTIVTINAPTIVVEPETEVSVDLMEGSATAAADGDAEA